MEIIKIDPNGPLRIKTPVIICDKRSGIRGRVFPSSVIKESIEKFHESYKKYGIHMCGTINSSIEGGESIMSLTDASHVIEDLYYNEEEHTLECIIRIVNTQSGRLLKSLIYNGKTSALDNVNNMVTAMPIFINVVLNCVINEVDPMNPNIVRNLNIMTINLVPVVELLSQFEVTIDNIIGMPEK